MKKEEKTFLCGYYACKKEIITTDPRKKFCNRDCKQKNRLMKKYWKKKAEKQEGEK